MPFFTPKCDYSKLKSNLRLCRERMTLLQKKKTEIGLKARREIAEMLKQGKIERSRIRTEQVVREDYVVEVMEILQMYIDLLLTRFGIFESSREVEVSLEKAIATLLWCSPRMTAEVRELKEITQQFSAKYSKDYVDTCFQNTLKTVDPVVMQKLELAAPSPALVESYMMEIARTYDIKYEPNLEILAQGSGRPKGGDGGGGHMSTFSNTMKQQEALIDFEPDMFVGPPPLPEGFNTGHIPWGSGSEETSIPGTMPYPSQGPFSKPGDLAPPPLPMNPPMEGAQHPGDELMNNLPPSYDAATYPEKQHPIDSSSSSVSSAPGSESSPHNVPVNPPYPQKNPVEGPNQPAEDTRSDEDDDSIDFQDLNRRFNQLTGNR